MEHGLEYITFCVKKYGIFGSLFWSPTGSRPATWGTRICHPHLPIKARTYIFIVLSNTSLHGNSAYSRIGKVFTVVDMFLFSVKNQKIVQLCIMK